MTKGLDSTNRAPGKAGTVQDARWRWGNVWSAMIILVACGDGESSVANAAPDISGTPYCASCEVRLHSVVQLSGTDAFPLDERSVPGRDDAGRWYVTATGGARILQFDASGSFVGSFGVEGDGPGELRRAFFLIGTETGVAVIQTGRVTWFDGTGVPVAEYRGHLACQTRTGTDHLLCAARSSPQGDSIVLGPVLELDPSRGIIRRFGAPPDGGGACPACEAYLASAGVGRPIWAVGARDYIVTQINRDTDSSVVFGHVASAWFDRLRPSDGGPARPSGRIWGAMVRGVDSLLIIGSAPNEDTSAPRNSAPRAAGSQTLDAMTAGYGTIAELVRPDGGVLVSTRFPGRRLMPFADSLLYEAHYDGLDNVVLHVFVLDVVQPSGGNTGQ